MCCEARKECCPRLVSKSVNMTLLRVAVVLFVFYFVTLFNGASFKDKKHEGKGRS